MTHGGEAFAQPLLKISSSPRKLSLLFTLLSVLSSVSSPSQAPLMDLKELPFVLMNAHYLCRHLFTFIHYIPSKLLIFDCHVI